MCPVKITEYLGLVELMIEANAGLRLTLSPMVLVASGAPSWYSTISTSASPFAPLPSVSRSATVLTAATGSPMSIWVMPPGDTSAGVSDVTAPTTPTVTPFTTNVANSEKAGVDVPLR